jgi:hypothetical protein
MNGVLSSNRNSRTEAGHESNNAIQPAHAPSMFQDTSRSYFGGGTFNNAGGSISKLALVHANVEQFIITIHSYRSRKWGQAEGNEQGAVRTREQQHR